MDRHAESGACVGEALPICVWMPGLAGTHPENGGQGATAPGIKRLWPGLPGSLLERGTKTPFVPGNLPCPPSVMRAFIADADRFARESAKDSTGISEAIEAGRREAERVKLQEELAALSGLAGGADVSAPSSDEEAEERRRARVQAQQTLGWIWLQQKNLAEIAGLLGRIDGSSKNMDAALAAEMDEEELRVTAEEFSPNVSDTSELEPDWHICFACALQLTAEDVVWVAEGGMLDDILEMEGAAFAPAPELASAFGLADADADRIYAAVLPTQPMLGARATAEMPSTVRIAYIGE